MSNVPKTIKFHYNDTACEPAELRTAVHIATIGSSKVLENLVGGDDVVVANDKTIIINIDYPLNNPATFTIESKNQEGGFTKKEVVKAIGELYRRIYKEEEDTWSAPPQRIEGFLNRPSTDGKHAIWGHDLEDLFLTAMEYDEEHGQWELMIDS